MSARALMVQGTASGVGKTLVVTGLCRLLARRGHDVAPFKAWNMALHAAVTPDGREVGSASALQALAARVELSADMNPVLVKPESGRRARTIVLGRPASTPPTPEALREAIAGALARLRACHALLVIEGAGSPAEINLPRDLANMEVARLADAPVVLVADLERGGAFAALAGTLALLADEERERVGGFVLNRMRGDPACLTPGIAQLERRFGTRSLGVLPHLGALGLPEEDGLALDAFAGPRAGPAQLEIALVRAPAASNLDELAGLEREPGLVLRHVLDARDVHGADLVVLPGSKDVRADLAWLRARGFERELRLRAERGEPLLGLCGGCQMLGLSIEDPLGVEGEPGRVAGLGFLAVRTRFEHEKTTLRVRVRAGEPSFLSAGLGECAGYEIHHGRLEREPGCAPALRVLAPDGWREEGALSSAGSVLGTLVHGLLADEGVRAGLLRELARRRGLAWPPAEARARAADGSRPRLEDALESLADALEQALDLAALERMLGLPRR